MSRPFNFRIAPLILMSIVLAILAITFCGNSTVIVLVILSIIALLSIIFIKKFKGARAKIIICIITFLLTLGLTSLNYARIQNREVYSENAIIDARIDILTECDENGVLHSKDNKNSIAVTLNDVTINGRKINGKAYAVFSDADVFEGYKVGDIIRFRGNIAPRNLVVEDAYSVLDYRDKIYHYIYCDVDFEDDGFCFYKLSSNMKLLDKVKLKFKSLLYSRTRSDTAGFLYAMTFGDKSGLDSNIKESFAYTGTAHVFAVSGLHIGIIAAVVLWIFNKIKLNNHIVRLVVMSVILVVFSGLCGFSPATIRASGMTFLLMLSKALGMRSDGLTNASIVASVILLFDQIILFDIGFLLSFFAVFGILTLFKPIENFFKKLKFPKKISGLLATSLAVNITLLPLMMYFFNGETLLFIIANLLLLPLLSLVFPIYLICSVISVILPFMGWLTSVVAAPFTLVTALIGVISKAPTLLINFSSTSIIILVGLLSVIAISQYVFAHKNFKRIAVVVFAMLLIFTTSTSFRLWGSNNLYVYCFSDKYDSQFLLVDNAFGGEYLIINDKMSSDSVTSVKTAMSENKFAKVDGIIVVGDVDSFYLSKLQMVTNCPYVYSKDDAEKVEEGIYAGESVVESGLVMGYDNFRALDIVSGKKTMRVLGNDVLYAGDVSKFDILVTYNAPDVDTDGKYVVCSAGFEKSIKNYVPSTFTFEIKNDKIKVQSSWRY